MSRFIALSSSHADMFSGYFSNVRWSEESPDGRFEFSPYFFSFLRRHVS